MSKSDTITVNIGKQLYSEISKEAEETKDNVKHKVESILSKHLAREKKAQELWEGLRIYENIDNHILLASPKERKFYDVERHEDKMYCKQDKSESCKHVSFVWFKLEDLLAK